MSAQLQVICDFQASPNQVELKKWEWLQALNQLNLKQHLIIISN